MKWMNNSDEGPVVVLVPFVEVYLYTSVRMFVKEDSRQSSIEQVGIGAAISILL